jgi:deoxyribonuclease-1
MHRLAAAATAVTIAFLPAAGAQPAGDDYHDYDRLASGLFWRSLYPDGGWTLYCGLHFKRNRRAADGRPVDIDHLYPIAAMLRHLECRNRMECRERERERFGVMEADMHNLYPVWQPIITYRNGRVFGEISGEDHRFDDCDLEWRRGVLEPRPLARGNIARAILYMQERYGLPLDPAEREVLVRWNLEDPPSRQELNRNDLIERLQGNRNPYIDDPERAKPAAAGRQSSSENQALSGW